jgi:hypothetical protein
MLYAITFAVHDCGFKARCTLEIDDAGRVRMDNILGLIRDCRFGIHDISRTELDETHGLPRFNMPWNSVCSSGRPGSKKASKRTSAA